MTTHERTQFDYLLNAFEHASQADKPAEHGYADKRKALFAYVRDLEARAALAARAPLTERQVMAAIHAAGRGLEFLTYDSGPYEVTKPTHVAMRLIRAVESAHGITPKEA